MDKKTSEALELAITKYSGYVHILKENKGKTVHYLKNIGIALGNKNCPLCSLFLNGLCTNCPVKNKVNNFWCFSTPYEIIQIILEQIIIDNPLGKIIITEELIKAFEDELEFLISLR